MQETTKQVIGHKGPLAEGDVIIVNDPYFGGTHLMDVRMVKPFYYRGQLWAYLSNTGHWSDTGGMVPGGFCATATEIQNEIRIMDPFEVFSARDLRLRSGAFLKNSEEGHLALVTKHGSPSILAVPFTERLLELGVHRTLALHLFENRHLTLARAAKLAAMSVEEFVDLLGQAGIPAADYPPEELNDELRAAS